jgi:lipopolysaccharide biosynthesis glycosyltransferase
LTDNYSKKIIAMSLPTSQTAPVVVVCASDDHYALPLSITLYSLLSHIDNKSRLHVFVFSLGITPASQARIKRVIGNFESTTELTFVDVDDRLLSSLPEGGYYTVATYLRLFIPMFLPEHYEKAIYLDADLLVFRDVSELWNYDIGDNVFLASHAFGWYTVSHPGGVFNWRELGIPEDAPYFNAGVLVINLQRWREQNLTPPLIKYAADYKEYISFADQGALNALCYNLWGPIEPTWNVTINDPSAIDQWPPSPMRDYAQEHLDELWNHPAIYHFTSQWKPWTPGHRAHFQTEWFDALKKSKWFTRSEYFRWTAQWLFVHYFRGISRKLFKRQVADQSVLAKPIRLWSLTGQQSELGQ